MIGMTMIFPSITPEVPGLCYSAKKIEQYESFKRLHYYFHAFEGEKTKYVSCQKQHSISIASPETQ